MAITVATPTPTIARKSKRGRSARELTGILEVGLDVVAVVDLEDGDEEEADGDVDVVVVVGPDCGVEVIDATTQEMPEQV